MKIMMATAAMLLATVPLSAGAATLESSELMDSGKVRASFLTRAAGARPAGMGEAYTALANDASAVSWNPGGLGQVAGPSGVLVYDVMGEGMGMTYLAGAMPAGPGIAGVSLTALTYGDLDLRDDTGAKTGTNSPMDIAVAGAYAMANPWGPKGSTGLALEFVSEDAGGALVCASLGTVIQVAKKWSAGLAILHMGPAVDGFSPPAQAKLGGLYEVFDGLGVALDGVYGIADADMAVTLGAEYSPHPMAVLRLGYKQNIRDQGLDGITGLTAGLGVNYGRFGLDYAYQPFGDLATSHRVALVFGRGVPAK